MENGVIFLKDRENDAHLWDDSALIKAYDAAVNSIKKKIGQTEPAVNVKDKHENSTKNNSKKKKKQKAVCGWKVGNRCHAVYSEDGITYEAVIMSIDPEKETCIIKYRFYDNEEKQNIADLTKINSDTGSIMKESSSFLTSDASSQNNRELETSSQQNKPDSIGFDNSISFLNYSSLHKQKHNNKLLNPSNNLSHNYHDKQPIMNSSIPEVKSKHSQDASKKSTFSNRMSGNYNAHKLGANIFNSMPPPFMNFMQNGIPPMPNNFQCLQNNLPHFPPPPMPDPDLIEDDKEALYGMLISWYMSGYYTGYYKGLKQQKSVSELSECGSNH